jgi:hypothetical protein
MIHGDVEWSASINIPNLRVGAAIQEEFRDIIVTAVESGHQRSDAFQIIGEVDVRARTDKSLHAVIATVASRVLKRGQSAVTVILRPGLRCHLGRPIRGLRAGLHIGALGDEKLDHLFRVLIRGGSPH